MARGAGAGCVDAAIAELKALYEQTSVDAVQTIAELVASTLRLLTRRFGATGSKQGAGLSYQDDGSSKGPVQSKGQLVPIVNDGDGCQTLYRVHPHFECKVVDGAELAQRLRMHGGAYVVKAETLPSITLDLTIRALPRRAPRAVPADEPLPPAARCRRAGGVGARRGGGDRQGGTAQWRDAERQRAEAEDHSRGPAASEGGAHRGGAAAVLAAALRGQGRAPVQQSARSQPRRSRDLFDACARPYLDPVVGNGISSRTRPPQLYVAAPFGFRYLREVPTPSQVRRLPQ